MKRHRRVHVNVIQQIDLIVGAVRVWHMDAAGFLARWKWVDID
jgi:hypothetical protein